jgi:hypothetical protein
MRAIFSFILLCLAFQLSAQELSKKEKLVQFSGIITDVDSNLVVPYVTITNLSNNSQKYAANYQGFFSFVAHPGDTILFTAIGFANHQLVLPTNISDQKYTVMVKMKTEVIYLQTVRVNPWATVEEFTKDFLSLRVADDDMAIAKKNLSRASINKMILSLPRDAQEIGNSNYRYNFDRMVNANMRQTNPLLNPFSWGKLMQEIFNGDKVRNTDQ